MAGTSHFGRLKYNVGRGLREIVAPRQTMPKAVWLVLKKRFNDRCVYCEEVSTKENRGIVPDHLVTLEQYGELVLGNTVPACQRCNDSRQDDDWKLFLNKKFPAQAAARGAKIEEYLREYRYAPVKPTDVLTQEEQQEYQAVLAQWAELLLKAQTLKRNAELRRANLPVVSEDDVSEPVCSDEQNLPAEAL